MLQKAGKTFERKSAWETRRLWSLWDMSVNFHFPGVYHVISELELLIDVSVHNAQFAESI